MASKEIGWIFKKGCFLKFRQEKTKTPYGTKPANYTNRKTRLLSHSQNFRQKFLDENGNRPSLTSSKTQQDCAASRQPTTENTQQSVESETEYEDADLKEFQQSIYKEQLATWDNNMAEM